MKIIYMHHAQREQNNPPTQQDDITALGQKDAEIVASLMKEANEKYFSIKAIYSSPFYRCKKTAEIINKKLNLPIVYDDRLNEFGSAKGETWLGLQKRVRACIKDIVYQYGENDGIICITSGVNVSAFIGLANKQKPSKNAAFIGVISCSPLIFNIDKENF